MTYDTAKRLIEGLNHHFSPLGWSLTERPELIPRDPSTLFVCSGMQPFKDRFRKRLGGRLSTLQSCLRTNDLDHIGDGTHLTFFEMIGQFSFGDGGYPQLVELWHRFLKDLKVTVDHVTVHPDRPDHQRLWRSLGYQILLDPNNLWTDGDIGGHCCELFQGSLELGNLVEPEGQCVDVGFGLERILQVLEGKNSILDISVFDQSLHPIVRDHLRTIRRLLEHGIQPGGKGRRFIMRRLIQRSLIHQPDLRDTVPDLKELWDSEEKLYHQRMDLARRRWRKYSQRPYNFWYETYGLSPEQWRSLRQTEA